MKTNKILLSTVVGRGTFWYSLNAILLNFVRLASIFVVLKHLNVYEYSSLELATSAPGFLGFLFLPGVVSVVIADMGVEKSQGNLAGMRSLFVSYIKLQAMASVVLWAVLYFGASFIAARYDSSIIGSLLVLFSFSALLFPLRSAMQLLFEVYSEFFLRSLFSFFEEVFKLTLLVVGLYVFKMRADGVVTAMIGSQILVMLLLFWPFMKLYRNFSSAPINNRGSIFGLLRQHGKWAIFSNYLNGLGQNIRLWIIKFTLGTEAVGIFSVAIGLMQNTIALFPLGSVLNSIIPQHVNDKERFYRIINKALKYSVISFFFVGLVAFVAFPPIIVWLFPNYHASMPLFRIMLLALIPLALPSILTPVFYAIKAQRDLFFAIALKTVLIIVFSPLFIWLFGLKGIAYEYVATVTLFTLERYLVIKKLLPGFAFNYKSMVQYDNYDAAIVSRILVFLKIRK